MPDDISLDTRSLRRIADALERRNRHLEADLDVPPPSSDADAFVWRSRPPGFQAVAEVAGVPLDLLCGIERQKAVLLENSARFCAGLPANNALLWGARGMGKSSLVKAVHARLAARNPAAVRLVEIHREDISDLPRLLECLRPLTERRFLIFCDDLSFEAEDSSYKSLKAALEGGIEGRPPNCLFYATSNRRHLLSRAMEENENAIHGGETAEEKISLSDRFGLWLGFHHCSQEEYLEMVERYVRHYDLADGEAGEEEKIRRAALAWSMERGARSGRVAWQFIQDFAGRRGKRL